MRASAIREFAVSKNPQLIAAAYFEKDIQIWDLNSQEKISEFPCVYRMGARTLAFSPSGRTLVTGKTAAHGGKIAAYEVPSGKKLWEHKLIFPRHLQFDPSGESILCTRCNSSVVRLDALTGSPLEIINRTERYIEGQYGDVLIAGSDESRPFRLTSREQIFNIPRLGYVLDTQFSPNSVCITEANGPVSCFSCIDGNFCWKFDPGKTSHVVRLHYSETTDAFWGILRNFEIGALRHLLRFDVTTGACEQVCEFESWEEAFLDTTDQLVTSAGEIRDLSNGTVVSQLSFPQREYHPDS